MDGSEEGYRAFFERSSEGIWRFELRQPLDVRVPEEEQIERLYADAVIAGCNVALARMHGSAEASALVGARFADVLPRTDPRNLEYLRAFLRSGYQRFGDEIRDVDARGRSRWFQRDLIGIVVDGRLVGGWGTQRDTSDRGLAEARLEIQYLVARELLRTRDVLEAAPAILRAIGEAFDWQAGALWRTEPGGKSLTCLGFWSAPDVHAADFERITRSRTFAPGEGLPGRVLASRRPAWIADLARDGNFPRAPWAIAAGLSTGLAFPIDSGEGVLVGVIEFFARARRAEDPGLLRMLAGVGSQMGHVLARRQAEAQGRASEGRKAAMLEAALDAVITIDAQGRVLEFNPAAERMLGRSRDEVIGREMAELFIPERLRHAHRAGLKRQLAQIAGGASRILGRRLEMPALRADGSEFPCELTVVRVPFEGQAVFTGYLRDITERKEAEAERARLLEVERAAREQSERAGRMKDEFVTTLSHELRTPLNAILGWAQILREAGPQGPDRQSLADGLETIERNARAQTKMVEELLDLSRILSGRVRLEVQPTGVAQVLDAAVGTLRPALAAKAILLEESIDLDLGRVAADPDRLQQVFWNLLSNAVKFTPRGGRIALAAERAGDLVVVRVQDSGDGIPADFLPHVFERFRQADASTTRRHGGLGLGLAIVKHIVELHGGRVSAASEGEGRGAEFTVELPAGVLVAEVGGEEAPRTAPVALAPNQRTDLGGVRVLVVDDDADTLAIVRRLLEGCRAEVATAESASEALASFARQLPDVLVSDLAMPDVDGYALIQQVRALSPEHGGRTPAVAITAFTRAGDRRRALSVGYEAHVGKPIEPAVLLRTVAELARRKGA